MLNQSRQFLQGCFANILPAYCSYMNIESFFFCIDLEMWLTSIDTGMVWQS